MCHKCGEQQHVNAAEVRWAKTPISEAYIADLVKKAPRLTEDQKARLRALLDTSDEAA